jgi:hypothetical protein
VFQDNELFNLVLTFAVLIFLLTQLRGLKRLPKRAILLSAYGVLFAGSVVTVLESVFCPTTLNIVEHACYALSGSLFSLWCWRALQPRNRKTS